MTVTEQDVELALNDVIEDQHVELFQAVGVALDDDAEIRVATFEDKGVLTRDRGLILAVDDDEFQIRIVRSR